MVTRPSHLFLSSTDGGLYDTRNPQWHALPPLRANYERPHREVSSVADLKAALRSGPYAWPGGYPLYFLTDDGAALSFDSVRREFRLVAESIRTAARDGWRVIACDTNWEDPDLTCDHSGARIESAYGETQGEESA